MFASTLKKMGLDIVDQLTPSKTPFFGIVPGNAATPIGQVTLPVAFGTRENFRTKYVRFEVVNLESSYHAILGRPALAQLIAIPHYVYLLLKMQGPKGVLTFRGDLKKSYDCDQEAIEYASTTRVPDTSGEVLVAVQQLSQSEMEIPSQRSGQTKIRPSNEVSTKTVQLHEGNSSKSAVIGGGLDPK